MNGSLVTLSSATRIRGAISLMRPKQWVKNGFVMAPLIFSGAFGDMKSIGMALFATILFCISSSATYIINDINDIERDRAHPTKSKKRPLAAGIITVPTALAMLGSLYVLLFAAFFVAPKVVMVCLGYMALNVAYTFYLKHEPVLDIFTIALGFVLRVYAGAMAIAVPVSGWMFITTMCLALYLAAVKRRQELKQHGSEARAVLKMYSVELVERYAEMSATGALVFYSMFVVSARPELSITIPLVLFGMFRYWYIVDRMDGGESPTDVLVADPQLIITCALWVAACCWALLPLAH